MACKAIVTRSIAYKKINAAHCLSCWHFFLLWVWIFGRGKKHQEEKWRQYFLELTSATSLPLDVWHNLITVNFHVNVTTFCYGWNDFCKRKKGASSDFRRHKLNHTNQISPFDHSIYWFFFHSRVTNDLMLELFSPKKKHWTCGECSESINIPFGPRFSTLKYYSIRVHRNKAIKSNSWIELIRRAIRCRDTFFFHFMNGYHNRYHILDNMEKISFLQKLSG